MLSFDRMIRFEDPEGKIHYGGTDLLGSDVKVLEDPLATNGSPPFDTKTRKQVARLLSQIAQATLIYSSELRVIIGKYCKDTLNSEDPLGYVLGYCVANDISSWYWQLPERAGKAGYAKGFDKFAPIGPILVSPKIISDAGALSMTTTVNGEQRQLTRLDDLIFDVSTLIRHLSRGMTLRKFTVILTGTPSGVGALMKPPAWLKDGDFVTVNIEKIGKISKRMNFVS